MERSTITARENSRVDDLRSAFPVFERLAYLNAGTCGPVPAAAAEAVGRGLGAHPDMGRGDKAVLEGRVVGEVDELRERAAPLLRWGGGELALPPPTTRGGNTVLP